MVRVWFGINARRRSIPTGEATGFSALRCSAVVGEVTRESHAQARTMGAREWATAFMAFRVSITS